MPWIDRSPLEYQVNTASSFRRWEDNRPPVSGANGDYKQFKVGDHWLDTTAQIWWILCYRDSTMGIWKSVISASGVLNFLTGDVGGAIGPDIGNNINIVGGVGITTTGNPVTNTISIALTSGALTIDHVIPDVGGTVSPDVLGNIHLIGSGGIIVTGTPGTNTLTVGPSGGGSITQTFTADVGAPVNPTVGGNLNILGGTGITTTGVPGTNTISIALTGGGQAIDTITGNVGGAVSPDINGNLNVIGTATNGINVTGNPGANTQVVAFQTPYSDGDFEFQTTIAGATRNLSITNTDNTNAASDAKIQVVTGGINSGDPFVNFLITGTKTYSIGIDNSDSDSLKITDGARPSAGNILWKMTSSGERTLPLQPYIYATRSTHALNATGAGANFNLIADQVVNERGTNYNPATGLFTCPVTGIYLLQLYYRFSSVTASMTFGQITWLVNGVAVHSKNMLNPANCRDSTGVFQNESYSLLVPFNAGDTLQPRYIISNGAGNTVRADAFGCGFHIMLMM
jgi:hypothetical protein